MPLNEKQFKSAKEFVQQLDTNQVASFEKQLAEKGFPWDKTDAIQWWDVSQEQKTALVKEVKPAGAQQKDCISMLQAFCTVISNEKVLEAVKAFTKDEYDRYGWFQYFYIEAKVAVASAPDTDPNAALVRDIGNSFFYVKGGDRRKKISFDDVGDSIFRQLLQVLLTIGFERMPATKQQMLAGDSSNAMIMNKMRYADNSGSTEALVSGDKEGTKINQIPIAFHWRGDSRNWNLIAKDQGFITKADSEKYAASKNMRAQWHPFSSEGFRSYMWFRKGQTDNCLFSVVSVGAGKWPAFLVYPKIALSGGKVAKVGGYLKPRKVRCQKVSDNSIKELDLPVAETYLYLFLSMGMVFDTGAAQGNTAYPEVGMANIPLKNIFGCLRFERYFLGHEDDVRDEDGQVVKCDKMGAKLNEDDALSIESSCGQQVYEKLRAAFNAVKESEPIRVAWTAGGAGYSSRPLSDSFRYQGEEYRLCPDAI